MKKLLDTLLRGAILMAPKWGLWILVGGLAAAFGEETGLPGYKLLALVGLVMGAASILYSVSEERKEDAKR